jgi:hypothetical protein
LPALELQRCRTSLDIDIHSDSEYSKHAYAFVCQAVITVFAPAGGEMSGLIAHFLFAAKTGLAALI